MTKSFQKLQQWWAPKAYLFVALGTILAPLTLLSPVEAAQLTGRNITLSDSGASGTSITTGVGSGTNVDYKVTFTPSTTAIAGIVIDFCSNSPLYFDNCTAPTGFNANASTLTVNNQTASLGTGSFAAVSASSTANKLVLTRASAAAPTGATASFELGNGTTNGITNPSTVGTFYARIYTYGTAGTAAAHSQTAATGGEVDFGGVALSTANVITITARVQESLIFCVSAAAPGSNCSGTSAPSLQIGHTSGGTAKIIDSSIVDTAQAFTQLSTNAATGAIIRMHNSNSCGGLSADGGTTCAIPAAASGASTPAAITAGSPAFGLYVAAGTGGTGSVSADANYNDGNSAHYGMDTLTSGANVTSTFGDSIASASLPVNNVNNTLTFAATAANSTPAGLYAANMSLIATGMF